MVEPKEYILEYIEENEYNPALIIEDSHLYIKSNEDLWVFPGWTRTICTGLELMLPDNSIGLITRWNGLQDNLQIDTQVIHDNYTVQISITNRGIFPAKITHETILADLVIIPKVECHVLLNKEYVK